MGHRNESEVELEGEDGTGHCCSAPTSATHWLCTTEFSQEQIVSDFCSVRDDLWD